MRMGPLRFDVDPKKLVDDPRWRPLRPGVDILPLHDATPFGVAAVLRYAPGASVPRHRHPGYEQILVLEGEQTDPYGTYPAGTLIVNEPGSEHDVRSERGCLVLIFWEKPVQFV